MLLHAYLTATTDHIGLYGKLRIAALEFDRERIGILSPRVEAADRARIVAREVFLQHETESHSTI